MPNTLTWFHLRRRLWSIGFLPGAFPCVSETQAVCQTRSLSLILVHGVSRFCRHFPRSSVVIEICRVLRLTQRRRRQHRDVPPACPSNGRRVRLLCPQQPAVAEGGSRFSEAAELFSNTRAPHSRGSRQVAIHRAIRTLWRGPPVRRLVFYLHRSVTNTARQAAPFRSAARQSGLQHQPAIFRSTLL